MINLDRTTRSSPASSALPHAPLSWQRRFVPRFAESSATRDTDDDLDQSYDTARNTARPCYGIMVDNVGSGNTRSDRNAATGSPGAAAGGASFDPTGPTADSRASRRGAGWGPSSSRTSDGASGGGAGGDGGAHSMTGPFSGRQVATSDTDTTAHGEEKVSAVATPWLVRTAAAAAGGGGGFGGAPLPAPLWDSADASEQCSPAERRRRIAAQAYSWKRPTRRFTDGDADVAAISADDFNDWESALTPRPDCAVAVGERVSLSVSARTEYRELSKQNRMSDDDGDVSPLRHGSNSRQRQHRSDKVAARRAFASAQAAAVRRGGGGGGDDGRRPPPPSLLDAATPLPSIVPVKNARRAADGRVGTRRASSSSSLLQRDGEGGDRSNPYGSAIASPPPANVRVLPLTGGPGGGMYAPGRRPSLGVSSSAQGLSGARNGGGGGGGDGSKHAVASPKTTLSPLGSVGRGGRGGPSGGVFATRAVNSGMHDSDVAGSSTAAVPPPPLSMCFGAAGGADMIAAIASAQKQKQQHQWHMRTTFAGQSTPDVTQGRRQTADT